MAQVKTPVEAAKITTRSKIGRMDRLMRLFGITKLGELFPDGCTPNGAENDFMACSGDTLRDLCQIGEQYKNRRLSTQAARAKLRRQWIAGKVVTHTQVKKVMNDLKAESLAMQTTLTQAVNDRGGDFATGNGDEMITDTGNTNLTALEGAKQTAKTELADSLENATPSIARTSVENQSIMGDRRVGDKRPGDSEKGDSLAPEPKRPRSSDLSPVHPHSTATASLPLPRSSVDYVINPTYGAEYLAKTLETTFAYLDQIQGDIYGGALDAIETAKLAKNVIKNALKNYERDR